MDTVTITIEPRLAADFPGVTVEGFVATGLATASSSVTVPNTGAVREAILSQGATLEALAAHDLIAPWRAATSRAGLKPSTYRSSPEALARRYLKGSGVSTGLPVVDLYCAHSGAHLAPLGAYDLARLPSEHITLRFAQPNDTFAPIGADDLPSSPLIPVYASGDTTLCWSFNHRDSRETCLVEGSDRALFLGEAVATVQHGALSAALDALAEDLAACGAVVGPRTIVTAEVAGARTG